MKRQTGLMLLTAVAIAAPFFQGNSMEVLAASSTEYDAGDFVYVFQKPGESGDGEYAATGVGVVYEDGKTGCVLCPQMELDEDSQYYVLTLDLEGGKEISEAEVRGYQMEYIDSFDTYGLDMWIVDGDVSDDMAFHKMAAGYQGMSADYVYYYDGDNGGRQTGTARITLTDLYTDETDSMDIIRLDDKEIPEEAVRYPSMIMDSSGACIAVEGKKMGKALSTNSEKDSFYGNGTQKTVAETDTPRESNEETNAVTGTSGEGHWEWEEVEVDCPSCTGGWCSICNGSGVYRLYGQETACPVYCSACDGKGSFMQSNYVYVSGY